jgi:DNA polymerase III delta prime subunit
VDLWRCLLASDPHDSDSKSYCATEQFLTKYRPKAFSEVIGNTAVVQALEKQVKREIPPRVYLFTGLVGIGKTTLAGIIAEELNAFLWEIDCGKYSGIDYARKNLDDAYRGCIMPHPNRLFLFDEAQAIGPKGWDAYLRFLEHLPNGLYVAFCTTDREKIPKTIKSRCYHVALKPVDASTLRDFIADIAKREGWIVRPDVLTAIVQGAEGSVRMALSYLQVGGAARSVSELTEIIPDIKDVVTHPITAFPEPEAPEEQDEGHERNLENAAQTRRELDAASELPQDAAPTPTLPTLSPSVVATTLERYARRFEETAKILRGFDTAEPAAPTELADRPQKRKGTHNVTEDGRRRISEAQRRRHAGAKAALERTKK